MSELPQELKYSKSHEWVRDNGDGTVTVGITDHAQAALGDLVYVEVPEVELKYGPGEACAVVESVKAASDVYSPLLGVVVAVNEELADEPERVNESPYEDGWLFQLRYEGDIDAAELLSADQYEDELED